MIKASYNLNEVRKMTASEFADSHMHLCNDERKLDDKAKKAKLIKLYEHLTGQKKPVKE